MKRQSGREEEKKTQQKSRFECVTESSAHKDVQHSLSESRTVCCQMGQCFHSLEQTLESKRSHMNTPALWMCRLNWIRHRRKARGDQRMATCCRVLSRSVNSFSAQRTSKHTHTIHPAKFHNGTVFVFVCFNAADEQNCLDHFQQQKKKSYVSHTFSTWTQKTNKSLTLQKHWGNFIFFIDSSLFSAQQPKNR